MVKPTKKEAEDAVKILIKWAGDNPDREGLLDTPKRVVNAFEEYFSGYNFDVEGILSKTFSEVENYDDIVLLKNMDFNSHCEHHMAPIVGTASIAYVPNKKVIGISKIARLLDIYSRRLQTQETMTSQIANALQKYLSPKGVAIYIKAKHQCMTMRGVKKENTDTVTVIFTGIFEEDRKFEERFFRMISV